MPRRSTIDLDALDAVARSQYGIVTSAQLEELDLPRPTLLYRARAGGPWQRLLPGIYLTNSGAVTAQQQAFAALAYSGPDAMLTGGEALRRHGFREALPTRPVQVLIPIETRRLSTGFVLVERTRRLPQPVSRDGLACAPVERAVIDACRRMTTERPVRALIAESVQRGFCPIEDLARELREGSARGSRLPRRAVREVTDGARSVAEAEALRVVRASGLPQPAWNVDLYTGDGSWIARPDAWWEEYGVALEIDSRAWHISPDDWSRTVRRHTRMTALGIALLHVLPARLAAEPAAVIAEIRAALDIAATRPRLDVWSRSERAARTVE